MNYNPDISITRRSSAVSRYCSAKSHFDEIEEQDEGGSRCDIENQSPTRLQHALLSNSGRKTKCRTPQQILYQAALRDDWESAEPILEKDLSLGRAKMTERGERVLHIAAVARSTRFVQKLVNKLEESDLELPNNGGTNAFCFAAASGVVKIASIMRDKNNKLPKIISKHGSAITMAALLGHKDMVVYLYEVTDLAALDNLERFELLEATIQHELYDVALDIFKKDTALATTIVEGNRSLLHALRRL